LVREWDGRDAEILTHREELASDVAAARARQDPEASAVYMGQGAGHVNAIRPASDVVRDICEGAESILRELSRRLG
jgi:NAD(P)H-dependent flavin oxidoreductase YrpB (nitropropane dioxygenase family)